MYQVRIHGRGGQGVVTAADMLSVAAFVEGHFAQAFPTFGSERFGAPVVAFCRVNDAPIRTREPVQEPDIVIVQDPTLLRQNNVLAGLRPEGYVLLNSNRRLAEIDLGGQARRLPPGHVTVLPATALAMTHVGRPVPNAALLGAFAALTGLLSVDSVAEVIRQKFPAKIADGNVAAAFEAHELVGAEKGAPVHA